ncbi:MAG: prolipoprotein diacylglyceryl transferase, partial [Sulfurospirillaceae bacterium]|nr:prolipoprotein diacylglyceryl transferase [Sulfurospirillaceae bacterium]
MEFWNNIYSQFNPIAFSLGSIKVLWYGMMYVLA